MYRARVGLGAFLFVISLLAVGCFQEIDRPSNVTPVSAINNPSPSPTTTATLAPTLPPTETPLPSPTSVPTATFVPTATATMIAPQTSEPTATATIEALPTDTPVPTVTSVPDPTATPMPRPTSTFTPTPTPREALFLEVLGPVNGQTVQEDRILVYGLTSPGASISINEQNVIANPEGEFQRIINLSEGPNSINIVASNGAGGEDKRTLTVTRLPLQPFILIVTTPENLSVVNQSPIQIIGVTSSQAIVSVNGITIDVGLGGIFETDIVLKAGELNNIDVIATNIDGEVKSTRISVFYTPG